MSTSKIFNASRRHQRKSGLSKDRRRLLLESLEGRRLLAAEIGNESPNPGQPAPYIFNITDTGSANETRAVVADAQLQIWDDVNEVLLDQIPLECVTEITINGASNPDNLIVDFSGGPFGVPFLFNGAEPTTEPGDQLTLINGVTEQVNHQLTDQSSGQVDLIGSSLSQTIQYTGLEPIVDNLLATDRSFSFLGGAETIDFSDDLTPGDDINQIDSTAGEIVTFLNPTNSLTISTGSGQDIVNLDALDSLSAFPTLNVNGGDEVDDIRLRSLNTAITATINGGAGSDVITIGSSTGLLDPILGTVNVNGDDQDIAAGTTDSVTALATTVTVNVTTGDQLIIDDSGQVAGDTYDLASTTVQRTGLPVIHYATTESLQLLTGAGGDTVNIVGTAAVGDAGVNSGDGDDVIDVVSTGDGSILTIDTGADQDSVTVNMTGTASLTRVTTGDGLDDLRVDATGNQAGLAIDAAAGDDLLTMMTTGIQSVTRIDMGAGTDVGNVRGTGDQSVMRMDGSGGLDTINVSSNANGTRLDSDGDLSGILDGVLGAIEIDGGGLVTPPFVTESVSAKGTTVTVNVDSGDELNLSDQASVTDNTYTLDTTQFQRAGLPAIAYAGIQILNVETGGGNDSFAITATNASTATSVSNMAGDDSVSITTTGADSLLVLDTGVDNDSVVAAGTGDRSVTRLITRSGDDDIGIVTTGNSSGLDIVSGTEVDVLTLISTGMQSVTAIRLGSGDDVGNMRGIGALSFTDVFAGSGNDTLNISSDADGDRIDPDGSLAGDLDGLLGELCVHGNDNLLIPETSESVTVKGVTVTATLLRGDELNISDVASALSHSYSLGLTTFQRVGSPLVVYNAIETLNIETGAGDNPFSIAGTRASTQTTIETNAGEDTVLVTDTGDDSIVSIDTGIDDDFVSFIESGQRSVTRLIARSGDDEVTVTATGIQSGLLVDSGTGSDVVTLVNTGVQTAAALRLSDGDDILNVRGTGDQSVTDLYAGNGNDTINVSSDADGGLLNPSGDPAGNLDGILGQLCVYGNSESATPETTLDATAKGNTISSTVARGDELNISDQGSGTDNTYSLSLTAFQRTGSPAIIFGTIETLRIETGSGNDTLSVASTNALTATEIYTYAGQDNIQFTSTGADSIVIVETGGDDDLVALGTTGVSSVTRLVTRSGADEIIVTSTGASSGLDINTGTEADVVTIESTGTGSVGEIRLAAGEDVANIRSTAATSFLDVLAGTDNDTINVSSAADGDQIEPGGSRTGNLDGLLGTLCVHGNSNVPTPTTSESVTAKGMLISVDLPIGDTLNLIDESSVSNNVYTLSPSQFQRVGLPGITYNAIETLDIQTGSGNDDVSVSLTRVTTTTSISTGQGNDSLSIQNTGDGSALLIAAGDQNDSVSVTTTGQSSVTRIATAAGDDGVLVSTTGDASGLAMDVGIGGDIATLVSTGMTSASAVLLGDGDDVANIRGSSIDSVVDLSAGTGTDTINVTSTANGTLIDPTGDQTGDLDGLLGDLCIVGDDHVSVGPVVDSVDARQTDGDIVSINVSIEQGDVLNVSDAASATINDYQIDATTLQRSAVGSTGVITYETVEIVNLATGGGDETVTIQSTAGATALNLRTGAGAATIDVQGTGAGSLLDVETGIGNDDVTIANSGTASLVNVETFDGVDTLSIDSLGDQAGIKVDSGAGPDQINLNQETSAPLRTANAIINVNAGGGEDTFSVDEVFLRTVVDLNGGQENDAFNLVADGSDSTGYLARLNDDPNSNPTNDAVAATRQLYIDGGANGAASATIQQGASLTPAPNPQPVEEFVAGIAVGDTINLDASLATTSLDLRYAITGPSAGVLATTTPADPRSVVGNEVFETNAIENINVISGIANDLMTVSSDVPYDVTQTGQRLSFDGGGGIDKFEVLGTTGDDLITIGDLAGTNEPFEVGNVSFLRIEGGAGDDQLVNRTAVTSVINGLGGSDTMLGGSGQDLLTGGAGVDFLFGRGGNDVLFTDQDLGNDTPLIDDGEIIDGGSETSIPTGDVCIQLGLDQIRNCEVVSDGGGDKDVLTWLRAILVDPGEIAFQPLNPVLDPFVPAFPVPVAALGVTEPSKLPLSMLDSDDPISDPSNLLNAAAITRSSVSAAPFAWTDSIVTLMASADPMDTNRDGKVSPADALFVINRLALLQPTAESEMDWREQMFRYSADVNRNGTIEPRDALKVINHLSKTDTSKSILLGKPVASEQSEGWGQAVDQIFNDRESDDALTAEHSERPMLLF